MTGNSSGESAKNFGTSEEVNQIVTPSDLLKAHHNNNSSQFNLILSGAILKTQLTPLQNKIDSPDSILLGHRGNIRVSSGGDPSGQDANEMQI